MAVGRSRRRAERRDRVVAAIGEASADSVLDLPELVELAWHDCSDETETGRGMHTVGVRQRALGRDRDPTVKENQWF